MSGTLQLLTHFGLVGMSIGCGIAAFHDVGVVQLVLAVLLWFVAYFHFADALWIPSWGTGADASNRVGIALRGHGFSMIAVSLVLAASTFAFAISFAGFLVIVFGRILWEMVLVGRTSTS